MLYLRLVPWTYLGPLFIPLPLSLHLLQELTSELSSLDDVVQRVSDSYFTYSFYILFQFIFRLSWFDFLLRK